MGLQLNSNGALVCGGIIASGLTITSRFFGVLCQAAVRDANTPWMARGLLGAAGGCGRTLLPWDRHLLPPRILPFWVTVRTRWKSYEVAVARFLAAVLFKDNLREAV